MPDKTTLVNKIDDINKVVKRVWTEQELSEKMKRQNELHARFSGAEREHLVKQLEIARIRGDEESIDKIQVKLDRIEIPRLAFKTSLTPQKKAADKSVSQQDKLAQLNIENRKRNSEMVRKAQLKERARTRELQIRAERGEIGDADPKRHISTSPRGSGTVNRSGTNTPANGTSTPKQTPKQAPLLPHIAKLQELQRSQTKSGIPTIHKPLMDDDIIGALDLDIDVEID